MMQQSYQVYVLENPTGRRYLGLSENVAARLPQHNAGVSKWTAKYRPWALAWKSRPLDLGAARRLENLLKHQKGGQGMDVLRRDFRSS